MSDTSESTDETGGDAANDADARGDAADDVDASGDAADDVDTRGDGAGDADESAGADTSTVDAGEVRHVAELARVRLADDEVETFAAQFGDILDYFEALDDVPETDREETLVNVMRPDEVESGLTQEEALSNAEETADGYFVGPKVS